MNDNSFGPEENAVATTALLLCQRALLGAISPNVRAVSIEWEGYRLLSIRVHYQAPPSEEEIEDMEVVTTELYADNYFAKIGPVERVVSAGPRHKLQFLRGMVYLRKE